MSLKKYFTYVPIEFKHFFSHRVVLVSKFLSAPLSMLVLFVLWSAIYENNNSETIGYFTKEQMLSYTALSVIFSSIIYCYADSRLGERIEQGDLLKHLIKPQQYYWTEFFSELGKKSCYLIFVGIPSVLFGFFLFGLKEFNTTFTLLSILSLCLAFIISYTFSMVFGLIAFRTSVYDKFGWLKDTIVAFFSGGYVSLSIFPVWFQNAMVYLPFQHMLYTPIRIFIGSYSIEQCIFFMVIQACWIAVLFFALKFGWNHEVKKFEGVGA